MFGCNLLYSPAARVADDDELMDGSQMLGQLRIGGNQPPFILANIIGTKEEDKWIFNTVSGQEFLMVGLG